jgi:hypothetical protein
VTAGGEALTHPTMQKQGGSAHVTDDIRYRYLWTKPVSENGDGIAPCIRASGEMAEHRRIERPPIATVNKDKKRALFIVCVCMEEVDRLPLVLAVGNSDLSAA